MARFTTALDLYGGVLWSGGELQRDPLYMKQCLLAEHRQRSRVAACDRNPGQKPKAPFLFLSRPLFPLYYFLSVPSRLDLSGRAFITQIPNPTTFVATNQRPRGTGVPFGGSGAPGGPSVPTPVRLGAFCKLLVKG
jgi:hypothetical protein